MYKYKKLQTLINYIITKHRNTSQGANKIIVSPLIIQELKQGAGIRKLKIILHNVLNRSFLYCYLIPYKAAQSFTCFSGNAKRKKNKRGKNPNQNKKKDTKQNSPFRIKNLKYNC